MITLCQFKVLCACSSNRERSLRDIRLISEVSRGTVNDMIVSHAEWFIVRYDDSINARGYYTSYMIFLRRSAAGSRELTAHFNQVTKLFNGAFD